MRQGINKEDKFLHYRLVGPLSATTINQTDPTVISSLFNMKIFNIVFVVAAILGKEFI